VICVKTAFLLVQTFFAFW